MLADRGLTVTGLEPIEASLGVARSKPGSDRARQTHDDAMALPSMRADLATMTANDTQAIVDPLTWDDTLRGTHGALRPGDHLIFQTRDPAGRAGEGWNRAATHQVVRIDGSAWPRPGWT